jgi:hypothetical protein
VIAGPLCRLPVLNTNPQPMEFAAGDGQAGSYRFVSRIRTDKCPSVRESTWTVSRLRLLVPSPRDAFRQVSGMGVSRQVDSEQANFRVARYPSNARRSCDCPRLLLEHRSAGCRFSTLYSSKLLRRDAIPE